MKKYKHIIFDLDGTIMDTSPGVFMSITKTLQQMGISPPNSNELKQFIGPPIEISFKKIVGNDDEVAKAAAMFRKLYAEEYLLCAKIYDGITNLLETCSKNNVECSIATYKRNSYTQKLLEGFHIKDKFNSIIGSDDEGRLTKSDIINLCIKRSGIAKSDTIMVGDTINDERSAEELEIDYIAVTYGFGYTSKYDSENATFVADSASEIESFLFG